MLPDPYETLNVAVKSSKARGAGEGKSDVLKCRHHAQITIARYVCHSILNEILIVSGLFAKKPFEKGTFISFYNGIRMSVDDLDENKKQVSC